jgi:hypothetical protein
MRCSGDDGLRETDSGSGQLKIVQAWKGRETDRASEVRSAAGSNQMQNKNLAQSANELEQMKKTEETQSARLRWPPFLYVVCIEMNAIRGTLDMADEEKTLEGIFLALRLPDWAKGWD